jgi:hypothetical protein
VTQAYPEDCLQGLVGSWWTDTKDLEVRRGHLLWAFVTHTSQIPYEFIPEGRGDDPTNHSTAKHRVEPMDLSRSSPSARLPVAGLPLNPGERFGVYRGKVRPVLLFSEGGLVVEQEHRRRGAPWQTSSNLLVAPYYGADASASRGGWKQPFVDRIRRCEYPQYFWDCLPMGPPGASILRLDNLQPIGRDPGSYTWTPHRLSADAVKIMDEWIAWLLSGELALAGALHAARGLFSELAP